MNLFEAFSVSMRNQEIIAFVGGGGKTSAIFRLARELKNLGMKVLVTTTTAIYVPDKALYDYFLVRNEAWGRLKDIGSHSITVLGQEITPENKLKGLPPETVDLLSEQGVFDMILVEADGSKSRPIKAPAAHEPVIPRKTSLVVGVIGMDCIGKSLGPEWVHRPEILACLTGKPIGDAIDVAVIIKLIESPDGLFKNCPDNARKIVLLNKVMDPESMDKAEKISNSLLNGESGVQTVAIGAVWEEPPVRRILRR